MRLAYYAVRSLWVETGLRFGTTAKVSPNSSPRDHLQWWQAGVDAVFDETATGLPADWDHPTLRLLRLIVQEGTPWQKDHFDNILAGRMKDLDVKQYETLQDLVRHAEQSCANLSQLVLISGNVLAQENPVSHEAARLVGVCHGLTNALRTSIPVVSTTGKLIIPVELTTKYGVRSPRYLLSALGQGDAECVAALQNAVKDIATRARESLQEARDLRGQLLIEAGGDKAVAVLLPGLASEGFLDRLQAKEFLLTDRNLRNVGAMEHFSCASRMILSYLRKMY